MWACREAESTTCRTFAINGVRVLKLNPLPISDPVGDPLFICNDTVQEYGDDPGMPPFFEYCMTGSVMSLKSAYEIKWDHCRA
uniref:Uncharacterized protein n=1 Tax=Romanomermis culicivorax TaxID=13658 RepID=A0A915ISC1_ROMCU